MNNQIKCPYCNKLFEPTDVYKHELEEKLSKETEAKHREEIDKLKQEKQELVEGKEKEIEEIKKRTTEKIKLEVRESIANEIKDKEEQILELKKRANLAEEQEIKIRKEKRQLEEDKEKFEVEKQRQIDQEREAIKKQAIQTVEEKDRFKFAEYEKQLLDMRRAVDEAQRRSNLGSQQLQGEVLELDFEKLLKITFPNDLIEPIEKGVKGADVRQTVFSPRGVNCGVILWETKRTKVWDDKWPEKLKEDLRAEKAHIPVIVSTVMPKGFKNPLGHKDGVEIVSFELAIPTANLLRKRLLDVGYQKSVSAHKGEKSENLYRYITSHEFRQQVEAMVETYFQMKNQIAKERMSYEKMWQSREKQIDKIFTSTANIAGSIQGEIGQVVFQIKGLDLLELESGEDKSTN